MGSRLYRWMVWNASAVFLILAIFPLVSYAQKPTLAIIEFDANGVSRNEANALSDRLQIELFQLDTYRLMERSRVDEILKEQGFQLTGCTSSECMVEAGRLIGIELIAGGSISKVGNVYAVTVRLIRVETGEIVNTAVFDHRGELGDLLTTGMKNIAQQLVVTSKEKTETAPEVAEPPRKPEPSPGREYRSEPVVQRGGIQPCLASCFIGPRVGLEMNEGRDIHTSEFIAMGGTIVGNLLSNVDPGLGNVISVATRGYMAYDMGNKNGLEGVLASYFLGPRIGNELDIRKIRTKEWMQCIPCVCIYPMITIPLEAYQGKTMTEIEIAERLRK